MNVKGKIKDYDSKFYDIVSMKALDSAKVVLPKCFDVLPKINSTIDFGCGQGVWLAVLSELGVSVIHGLDGSWINKKMSRIPINCFSTVDFRKKIFVDKKYDLALSLEVAEHIDEKNAKSFVESLTCSADFILFSAAVPLQGGTKHVNEQWPDYWSQKFSDLGFEAIDCIRPKIWNDKRVAWFYKQNVMLYVKKDRVNELNLDGQDKNVGNALSYVHPDMFLRNMECHIQYIPIRKGLLTLFKRLIKNCLRIVPA